LNRRIVFVYQIQFKMDTFLKPHGIKESAGIFFLINKYVVPYLKSFCNSTCSN